VSARYALAVGRFYEDLADRLVAGAREELEAAGVSEIDVFDVPGAFELPLAAKYAAESGRYAGVVCLGAVIRGETSHYDHVCAEAARGIAQVSLDTGVPCAFGVLTVETMEQALARAGGGKRHQGEDAARAVLQMAELRRSLSG
jgi:6,7-dimethyl-8-ribityllumazine synthase